MSDDTMRAPGERAQGEVVEVRDGRGRRRRDGVRAQTISVKRWAKRALEADRAEYPDEGQHAERPRTRAECPPPGEPCPWVSCKHHLYLDVNDRTGSIKLNFPDLEVWELPETCALRVADRDGATLEEIAALMNLTRERVRQLEGRALRRVHLAVFGKPAAYPEIVERAPPRPTQPTPDPVPAPVVLPEATDAQPEHRVTHALHLAGWRKVKVRKLAPSRWQSPDGRLVSQAVAYREAAALIGGGP